MLATNAPYAPNVLMFGQMVGDVTKERKKARKPLEVHEMMGGSGEVLIRVNDAKEGERKISEYELVDPQWRCLELQRCGYTNGVGKDRWGYSVIVKIRITPI